MNVRSVPLIALVWFDRCLPVPVLNPICSQECVNRCMRYEYIQQLYVTLSVAHQNGEVDCKTDPILILRGTDCLPGYRQLNFSLTSVLNIEHWYRCLRWSTINQTSRLSLEERWEVEAHWNVALCLLNKGQGSVRTSTKGLLTWLLCLWTKE